MAIVERGEKCVLINDSGDMINTELSNEGELKISNGTLFSLTIDFDAWLEDGSDPLRLKEFIEDLNHRYLTKEEVFEIVQKAMSE